MSNKQVAQELARVADQVMEHWQKGKATVLYDTQSENYAIMVACLSLYKRYSQTKNLTMDAALSIAMQAMPSASLTAEQLWLLSRMPVFLENPNQVDDLLLPTSEHIPLAFGDVNISQTNGYTFLTYHLVQHINQSNAQNLHLVNPQLSEICSPIHGGSLLLTD